MLTIITSFFSWLVSAVNELQPILSSWIIQVPLLAWYVFRILDIFHAIIPDK